MAKLIVNPTSSNRREIPLARTTILTIGRDPSNDLVLPDSMVSRRHAVIEHRGSQFFLRDSSSANGSVVNGDRVSERGLRDGDLVAIGSMRLLFREEPVEAGAAARSCLTPRRRRSCAPPAAASTGAVISSAASAGRRWRSRAARRRPCAPRAGPRCRCPPASAMPAAPRWPTTARRVEEPAVAPEAGRRDTQPLPIPPPAELTPPRAKGSMAMAAERAGSSAAPAAGAQAPGGARRARGAARSSRSDEPSPPRGGPRAGRVRQPPGRVRGGHGVRALGAGGHARARRLVLVGARGAAHAGRRVVPAGLRLGDARAARAPAGRALPRVLLEREGRHPGKELLDLRVETDAGASPIPLGCAALRAFGYLLSAASLGIGFLMVAFGGSGLHDRIAGTRVVKGTTR